MKRILLFLLAAFSAGHAQAVEPATPAKPVGPIDVTIYVAKGVDYFRAQAATNEDGWFFHPIIGSRIVGWQTNIVHYKTVEVKIPGYRPEDPYEVLVPGNTPNDPMRRETRYRTMVRDPSRDYMQKQDVLDPNGPIERNNPIAIYEKDEGVRWRYDGLGNNALAIFTLRRCGMPADDPLLVRPASNLARLIHEFGLPDSTYDLAWLTAAFAVMPGDYKELTQDCAAKLLDAQITTGPATGLWGPVAINTPMAATLLKMLGKLADQKKALEKELSEEEARHPNKNKPSSKAERLQEEITALDGRLSELQDNRTQVTQLGMLMFDIFGNFQYGLDGWGRRTLTYQADRLAIETLPYLIQNQISADLESTALALYALRVALENGRLPARSWRPEIPKVAPTPGVPPAPPTSEFPPAREARDVIALAARTLKADQPADGQWTELNIHQRVTDYAWLKAIPQLASNEVFKLPEPVTMASIARGAAALDSIQMMVAGKSATPLESPAYQLFVQYLAANKLVLTNTDVRLPYDTLYLLTALRTKAGKPVRTDYSTWNQMAEWLAGQQTPGGNWGRTNAWVLLPSTSLQEMRKVLKNITDADLPKLLDKPHLTPPMFYDGDTYNRFGAPESSYFTIQALLFLADGLPEGWVPVALPPPPPATVPPPPPETPKP